MHGACLLVAVFAFLALLAFAGSARADGVRIRIRGTSIITAQASQDHGDLLLSGSLVNDANEPLVGETITVHIVRESSPHDPAVGDALASARDCETDSDRTPNASSVRVARSPSNQDIGLLTNEGGRFCFRAKLPVDLYSAHLAWAGGNFIDGSTRDLLFDLSRAGLVLRFDPVPHVIELDEPQTTIEVLARVDDGAIASPPNVPMPIRITNEHDSEIATAFTNESGRARFEVASSKFGAPGIGLLRASFAGTAAASFPDETARIERRVKVSLSVPNHIEAMVPGEGIPIAVNVTSSMGPVLEGSVEARIGDALVGRAPVEQGIARPTLTFAAQVAQTQNTREAVVQLRYVPNVPFYEPTDDVAMVLPLRKPSMLAKVPIFLAGLVTLAFFFGGRIAIKRTMTARATTESEHAQRELDGQDARPHVKLVRAANRGEAWLVGSVTDAHDDAAIAHARVRIERGSFDGTTTLAQTEADAFGRFRLDVLQPLVQGDRLVAEAPLHTRLEQQAPRAGEISIALVSRRRALLARMVAWARRVGVPFDTLPEPTPRHIRQAAGSSTEVARWAEAVEQVAFGQAIVDANAESAVDHMSPSVPRKDPCTDNRR